MSAALPVAGAAIGALGSLGGSGGGSTSSSQQSTQQSTTKPSTYAPTSQGYLDSIPVYQAAGQQAISALNGSNNANQANLAPLIQGSYSAFDSLLDSLGVARPAEGSYIAAQRKATYDNSVSAYDKYQTDLADYQKSGTALSQQLRAADASDEAHFGQSARDAKDGEWVEVRGLLDDPNTTNARFAQDLRENTSFYDTANAEHQAQYKDSYPVQMAALKAYDDYNARQAPAVVAKPGEFSAAAMTDPSEASARTQALLESDPNYQFQLAQGNKSIQAMAAAQGMNNNPRVAQELQTFGQGQAASAMQSYRDRLTSIINQGAAGLGLSTASNTNNGNNIAQMGYNTGQSVAGATQNATNTWQVGPITQQSSGSSSGSSSGGGNSTLQNIGNIAKAGTGFLSSLASIT